MGRMARVKLGWSIAALSLLAFCLATGLRASSETVPANKGTADLRWFAGRWSCDGKFIDSGKGISADLSFEPTLDGKWIVFRHDDRPPFSYHALSEWGWDEKGQRYVSIVQDSTGGVRSFYSNGLVGSKLVWEGKALGSSEVADERFEFTKNEANSFTVTYSLQKDKKWQQVDTSVCSRQVNAVSSAVAKAGELLIVAKAYHESVSLSLTDFRSIPHATVTVHNSHSNADQSYSGVPLSTLLAKVNAPLDKELRGDAMQNYIIASGTDAYSVVLSLAEVDPAFHAGQVFVADSRDGKPLDKSGPFELIVTDDKRPARWVHNLTSIVLQHSN